MEDNPNDAELILRVLSKHNMANQVVLLKDGAEAWISFSARRRCCPPTASRAPRVVLLDIKLPKVDGIEVLRRMKSDERTKDIPVVILTSSTRTGTSRTLTSWASTAM